MKKKSQRVPDFSTKKPLGKRPDAQTALDSQPHVPAPPQPTVKPPSTSQKSGRRGS